MHWGGVVGIISSTACPVHSGFGQKHNQAKLFGPPGHNCSRHHFHVRSLFQEAAGLCRGSEGFLIGEKLVSGHAGSAGRKVI